MQYIKSLYGILQGSLFGLELHAISNDRLLDIEGGKVRFRWKDYRRGNRQKAMMLTADEFIRRFLLHVLPKGFQRIRYYGFLGNRHREDLPVAGNFSPRHNPRGRIAMRPVTIATSTTRSPAFP